MDLQAAVNRVFQAYDVRGIYPDHLTPDIAFRVGWALAVYLDETGCTATRRVAIGRDMRIGSEEIAGAVARGLAAGGIAAVDLGLVSADMIYFVTGEFAGELDAGVMVTASHNPPEFNGLKFVLSGARSICANTGMNLIRDIVIDRADDLPPDAPRPPAETRDIYPAYLDKLFALVPGPFRPCTILADAGNGIAGKVFPIVAERLPCTIIPLNFELDGAFPVHSPDPTDPDCLAYLRREVLAHGSDLGLIFDGDADRMAMVDEQGNVVAGGLLTCVLAQGVLEHEPGGKVLFDLTTGWAIEDCVREAGGEPIIAPVGHSRIKERMRRLGAAFAGEQSGHYYFRDFYYCDSAMAATLLALAIMAERDAPLSELAAPYAHRYWRAPNFNVFLDSHDAVLAAVERIDRLCPDGPARRVTRVGIDVRKDYEDWWFSVRPSGTEPCLFRITVEAKTQAIAERRMAELRGHIEA